MSDDQAHPANETPPPPQPEENGGSPSDENEVERKGSNPGVDKESADSFPASDPPSW